MDGEDGSGISSHDFWNKIWLMFFVEGGQAILERPGVNFFGFF